MIETRAGRAVLIRERYLKGPQGTFDLHSPRDAWNAYKVHGFTGTWRRDGKPFFFEVPGALGALVPPLKTCASVFTGGGGWEVGARQAGLTPLWGVESSSDYAAIYQRNFPESRMFNAFARDVNARALPTPDVLFVSPPCQDSSRNRTTASEAHCSAKAGRESVAFIAKGPRVLLFENAPDYLQTEDWQIIFATMNALGYAYTQERFRLGEYGVPQERDRLIFRAIRGAPIPPRSPPTVERDTAKGSRGFRFVSWGEVLLPYIQKNYAKFPRAPVSPSYQRWVDEEPPPDDAWPVLITGSNASRRGWRAKQQTSMIIATGDAHNSTRILMRNGESLKFTPRMAAMLQTFPDDYQLPAPEFLEGLVNPQGRIVAKGGNVNASFDVIGNAVPPLASRKLLEPFL